VRLRSDSAAVDALMAVTLGTWAVYALYLVLRFEAGWHGRRAAYLALAGFALVIIARLGLQVTHFS
jgi:ABC-type transport system involved in cytochrome c biogenesis permease subunit